jgi:hypothetical protein
MGFVDGYFIAVTESGAVWYSSNGIDWTDAGIIEGVSTQAITAGHGHFAYDPVSKIWMVAIVGPNGAIITNAPIDP